MGKRAGRLAGFALFALVASATPSYAQATGHLRVVFAKAGMIVGAGGGHGTLTYRGRDYPFTASGVSLGVTVGASAARLAGRADHLRQLSDFPGMYSAVGIGGALAGGAAQTAILAHPGSFPGSSGISSYRKIGEVVLMFHQDRGQEAYPGDVKIQRIAASTVGSLDRPS